MGENRVARVVAAILVFLILGSTFDSSQTAQAASAPTVETRTTTPSGPIKVVNDLATPVTPPGGGSVSPSSGSYNVETQATPTAAFGFADSSGFNIMSRDLDLAKHWAPVWYQDTDSNNYRADYITNFDFDSQSESGKDWDATNNWENLEKRENNGWKYPLRAYIYYWIVETETHWFIGYADFHPRDWAEWLKPLNYHENDMEGGLLVVEKDGSAYGKFKRMLTKAHHSFYSYDAVKFYLQDHVSLYVEAKGHGVYGKKTDAYMSQGEFLWPDWMLFPGNDGIIYYPYYDKENPAQEPEADQNQDPSALVSYALRPINELWDRRNSLETFCTFGKFASSVGSGNANAPWGWDDTRDGEKYPAPYFFLFPAYLSDAPSSKYLYRSYQRSDTAPPTVDAFDVAPRSVSSGNSFTISYTVSDSGGTGLNRVELWRATDVDGDGKPNWPKDPIRTKPLSGDSASGSFSDPAGSPGCYWYGLHVVDNTGNWNDEQNSKTGGSPGDFGPIQVSVARGPWIDVNEPTATGLVIGEATNPQYVDGKWVAELTVTSKLDDLWLEVKAGGVLIQKVDCLALPVQQAIYGGVLQPRLIAPRGSITYTVEFRRPDEKFVVVAQYGLGSAVTSIIQYLAPLIPKVNIAEPITLLEFYGKYKDRLEAIAGHFLNNEYKEALSDIIGFVWEVLREAFSLDPVKLLKDLGGLLSLDRLGEQIAFAVQTSGLNKKPTVEFEILNIPQATVDAVAIVKGPEAAPKLVASRGTSNLSVQATDSLGHIITYRWQATGGTFSNVQSQNPIWYAPTNQEGLIQYYTLSVTATCALGKVATGNVTVGVQPENRVPTVSKTDISGQPATMYPDTLYSVSAKYYDPDGRSDLKYLYLRLTHPTKPITMMWHEPGDWNSPWAGDEGTNYLTVTNVTSALITNGYQLTWTFKLCGAWSPASNTIDFGVFAWDDGGLKSGWSYDDTNASFDAGPADTTPPVISNVSATNPTTSGATISWQTDEPATSQVVYDTVSHDNTSGYRWISPLDATFVTSHSAVLSDLAPDTIYHYRVKSADNVGNEAVSPDFTFRTSQSSGAGPPLISKVIASNVTSSAAIVYWQTDKPAKSQVVYDTISHNSAADYQWSSPLDSNLVTSHTITISGLNPGTIYHYRVRSADSVGNEAVSADYAFTTSPLPAIGYGPFRLDFLAVKGGPQPISQKVTIWNSGGGTLNWAVTDDVAWLTANPSNGSSIGEADEVTVGVDTSALNAGDYSTTVTIAATGAANSPRSVQVFLTVSSSPAIGYSPQSFSFSAVEAGPNPLSQTLAVWNTGGGTLGWSVSDNVDWLNLTPQSGNSTGETDTVAVSVVTANMTAGSYSATITISAPEATSNSQAVQVSLNIYSQDLAKVIRVPGDQPYVRDIQAGIDFAAAWPGSTVLIAPGTYKESIRLREGVKLIGENKQTTIIAAPSGSYYAVLGADKAKLSGFTISGGYHGINLGVGGYPPSSPEISNNIITGSDYAITVGQGASPVIRNNVITGVRGAIYSASGMPMVKNNLIYSVNGTGIDLRDSSSATIINNVIDSVGSPTFPAVYISSTSDTAVIKNNIFANLNTVISNPSKSGLSLSHNNFWNVQTQYYDGQYGLPANGVGDLSADPLFVDSAGGDYHLQDSSPCIDAGDPAAEYNDAYRPPSKGTIRNDMGAYGGLWSMISSEPPFVAVLSPNGGERLEAGSYHKIRWVATDDIAVASVNISYSVDGGLTYPYMIATGERNDGAHVWPVPDVLAQTYRIKVVARDNEGNSREDTSDGSFAIVPSTGPRWLLQTVDNTTAYVGEYTSLAFDSQGNPAISYRDGINQDLKYARWNGVTWDIRTVDSVGSVGWYTSLAFDKRGYPAISYRDSTNQSLKYASFNGTSWLFQTVDSTNAGGGSSLAFDNVTGNPAISYVGAGKLKYVSFNGIAWGIPMTVDTVSVGPWTSLHFDAEGKPAISYYADFNYDLKYAHFNGTTWDKQIVDDVGNVGYYSSLAFDRQGNPAIAYHDESNFDLKYVHFNGISWENPQTVDSAGKLGGHTSLAFDAQDRPAISYWDWSNYDLKYAIYNGTAWVPTTVDSPGEVGEYTSLAFDRDGYPAISYYDATNGHLKLVRVLAVGDTTPPSTPIVIDQGNYSANTTQLQAVWSASDPESDIVEYQYAIGTSVGGTEIVNWTSAGTDTKVVVATLTLISRATYYLGVKAKNSAGLWSNIGVSDGITIDTSPPEVRIVALGTAHTGDNTPTFTGTAFDDVSPVVFVQYRVDGGGWTIANALDGAFDSPAEDYVFTTATLLDGTHIVETRATNAAGIVTLAGQYASANFTVDTVAPIIVGTSPQNGEQNVAIDVPITVILSETMNRSSVKESFSIIPAVAGSFTWNDSAMTFNPDADLAYGTRYTVTVSAAAQDVARNNLLSSYSWSFTTKPLSCILTISVTGSGTTLPEAGVYTYAFGASVNVTAAPAAGWIFSHWSGDASGSVKPITVTMNSNKSITANFAPQGITLIGAIKQELAAYEGRTVKTSGVYRGWEAGHGSPPVTRSDWVMQDATSPIYVTGSALGLRYPDDLGKPITVNGIVRLKNGQPYIEIPLTPPRVFTGTVTNRTADRARLSGSLSSLGSASTANVSFQWGTSPRNYAGETVPASVSTAREFSIDLSGLVPGKTYYFRAKAMGDGTAYGAEIAFTTLKQYTLTITVAGNGGSAPAAGTYTYSEGMVVSVTATPSAGWQFSHWSGDAVGRVNPITVSMSGNKVITADFAPEGVTLISAIRQNPAAHEGKTVKIRGEYRGLEPGHGTSPVTRNDWVVRDTTGFIYVTGASVGLKYPGDVGKPVTVTGVVRLKNDQPYIEIPRK